MFWFVNCNSSDPRVMRIIVFDLYLFCLGTKKLCNDVSTCFYSYRKLETLGF